MNSISPNMETNLKIADDCRRAALEARTTITQSREALKESWLVLVAARRLIYQAQDVLKN